MIALSVRKRKDKKELEEKNGNMGGIVMIEE